MDNCKAVQMVQTEVEQQVENKVLECKDIEKAENMELDILVVVDRLAAVVDRLAEVVDRLAAVVGRLAEIVDKLVSW